MTKSNKIDHQDENTEIESKNIISQSFPVVGIGASAGGLEALEQFFFNMPANSGMAFVVIQHLDPNHVGILPELLQRTTKMPVTQVTDHLLVKPNNLYVIPPNKSMSILNGYLHLFEPIELRGFRLPIDYFFRSLADDQQANGIGIILSGMGSDGSLGLKAIKEKNGLVAVQTPATAKFDGMPQSAIASVIVDILAPPNELPAKIIKFLKFTPVVMPKLEIDEHSKTNLEKIVILLRSHTGNDFSQYKKNTMFRRIERRMVVHQIDKIPNYIRFLQENPKELDILFKELLIGVTNFFRDMAVWDKLKESVLPNLFNELPNGHAFRAWVTACSTGEEAYSLAILFKEAYEKVKLDKNFTLQIFATDIDKDAIEEARKGVFSSSIVNDVSPERISQYFTKEGDGFRVNTEIREMIVFAPHNVIKEPPFTKLDLLMCRNLLIYMEPELQKKLMNLFHYSLNPGGVMLLGSAENENSNSIHFSPIDAKLKIYKRSRISVNRGYVDFPSSFLVPKKSVSTNENPIKVTENIQFLTDQLLLQRFAPASVLINQDGDILYITGRTGSYLEPAAGKANMNIYAMAREGLSNELPGAIRKAKQTSEPIRLCNIKVGTNGGAKIVDVTIQLIDAPNAIKGTIIIVFAEVANIPKIAVKGRAKNDPDSSSIREQQIELELQRANDELQSTREEMQTTQEELKSTNEEMQSTNEELQSTNEELTTSKEEMQSLNEELQTVNVELQSKISDFMAANNDMKNLLNSTDIATLFLDRELNIRRFTDQLVNLINLRSSDVGRPFTDMVSQLQYPEIANHAREVLRTLISKETIISTINDRWFTVRIMPYRTFDDHIDGLVITFIDITIAKTMSEEQIIAKEKIAINEARYHGLLNNIDAGIVVYAPDTTIIHSNQKASEILGLTEKLAIDPLRTFILEDHSLLPLDQYPVNLIAKTKQPIKDYILGISGLPTQQIMWVSINGFPVFDSKGALTEIVISFIDITIAKNFEVELALTNIEEKEAHIALLTKANNDLKLQNLEKEKRSAELINTNRELALQNHEKGKLQVQLKWAIDLLKQHNLYKP